MNPELMEDYKKELLENIEEEMKSEGNVSTFIQVIGEKEGVDKPIIVHVVTRFDNDDSKDFFIKEIIPEVGKKLRKSDIKPQYVVFVSEVWVTRINKNTLKETKDEAVFISFSSENTEEVEAYTIIKHDYEVDENGELSSKVELKKDEELSGGEGAVVEGRFSGLYKTLMKEFNK